MKYIEAPVFPKEVLNSQQMHELTMEFQDNVHQYESGNEKDARIFDLRPLIDPNEPFSGNTPSVLGPAPNDNDQAPIYGFDIPEEGSGGKQNTSSPNTRDTDIKEESTSSTTDQKKELLKFLSADCDEDVLVKQLNVFKRTQYYIPEVFSLSFFLTIRQKRGPKRETIKVNEVYDYYTYSPIRTNIKDKDKIKKINQDNEEFVKKLRECKNFDLLDFGQYIKNMSQTKSKVLSTISTISSHLQDQYSQKGLENFLSHQKSYENQIQEIRKENWKLKLQVQAAYQKLDVAKHAITSSRETNDHITRKNYVITERLKRQRVINRKLKVKKHNNKK